MVVAFCASEVFPFAKTGGLADVCGTLPSAIKALGHDVILLMPGYPSIHQAGYELTQLNNDVAMTTTDDDIPVYFICHSKYFEREGLYGTAAGDYPDNLERFQYFCQKTLEVIKQLNLSVDVLHCHDWQTALIPVYLRFRYHTDDFYKNMVSVLSIHNLAYQGSFDKALYEKIGLPTRLFHQAGLEFYGNINLLKAGIVNSDAVTTVSPTYAQEIQTEVYGCGLDGVLRDHRQRLLGILNGIDYTVWNPETDRFLPSVYSAQQPGIKAKLKSRLQGDLNLPVDEDVPLLAFVGRLSHQKGIDLLIEVLTDILEQGLQVVVLGSGEQKHENMLCQLAGQFADSLSVRIEFNETLAHLMYAASDFFLMPSVYEPCGLTQMIAMCYGSVPVVYHTGGLVDTVIPYEQDGNGFVFTEYTPPAFRQAIERAVSVYDDPEAFEALLQRVFAARFPWSDSARQYVGLYEQTLINQ